MTKMDDWTVSLLTNTRLLNLLNGDFVSKQVYRDKESCVWSSVNPKTGESYVALFNLTDEARSVSVSVDECASGYAPGIFPANCSKALDVWTGSAFDSHGVLEAELPPHGTKLIYRC